MEDVFLQIKKNGADISVNVAILVIMEDVFLQVWIHIACWFQLYRRNPCYNGRCISTKMISK